MVLLTTSKINIWNFTESKSCISYGCYNCLKNRVFRSPTKTSISLWLESHLIFIKRIIIILSGDISFKHHLPTSRSTQYNFQTLYSIFSMVGNLFHNGIPDIPITVCKEWCEKIQNSTGFCGAWDECSGLRNVSGAKTHRNLGTEGHI